MTIGDALELPCRRCELAYMAGILDGEGTITIARAQETALVKRKKPAYIPHVKVCNTNKELMDWVHRTFGGRMNNERPATARWSTLYYVRWNCRKAQTFLELMLPFLRIKKLQALLVLEAIKRRGNTKPGATLSAEEDATRAMLYLTVTALNKRGPRIDAERLSEEAARVLGLVRQSELAERQRREADRNDQLARAESIRAITA